MKEQPTKFDQMRSACASKPHGTRARYISGCKCLFCRAANSRYSCEAQKRHDTGETGEIVSAAAARTHLAWLSSNGIGRRSVAEACDVAESILQQIKTGRRQRIRASTERKILSVNRGAARGGTLVSSSAAMRQINELVKRGYTKAQLARWLGMKTPALQIKRGKPITAGTAAKVERMYRLANAGKLRRQ